MDETPCNNLYDDKLMAYIYDDVDDSDIFAFKPSVQDSDGSKNVQDNITLNTAPPSTNTNSLSIIAENEEFKLKIKQLESEKSLLELRISEVYRTAKAELERKDKRLLQLNDEINNLVFRRKDINSQPYKQPYKVQDTSRNNVIHQSQPKDSNREKHKEVRQKIENLVPSTHCYSNVQIERDSSDVLIISDEDVAFVQSVYELKTDVSDKSEVSKMESKPELRRSPRKSVGAPKTIKNELKSSIKQVPEEKNLRDSNNLKLKLNKKINEDCFIKSDDVLTKENGQHAHTGASKNHLKLKEQKTLHSISNSEQNKSHRCSERINNINRSKNNSSNPHQEHEESYTKLESVSKSSESRTLMSNTSNFVSSRDVKSKEHVSESRQSRSKAPERNSPRTPSGSPTSSLPRNKTSKRTDHRSLSRSPRRHRRTCQTFRSISPLRTHRNEKSVKEQLKKEEERFELRLRSRGDISFRTKDRGRRSPSLCFSKSMPDAKRSEKVLDQRDRYGNIITSTYGEWRKLSKLKKEFECNKVEDKKSRKMEKTSVRRNQIDCDDIDTKIKRDIPNRKEGDIKPIESFKGINKLCKPDFKSKTQNDESELVNKNQKAKVTKDEVNIISKNDETQDDNSELLKNNKNNTVLINDNSFLHDLSMSDDEDDNTFEKMKPIKDDKVEMKISILDVVVIPADSSLSLPHTPDTRKDTVPNFFEASTESYSRQHSDNFECIEQIQEAINTNVLRPEHTSSMVSLSELGTEELQKCLEDGIPQSPILPQISPDNVILSKSPKRIFNEKIIRLFGSDSPVKSEFLSSVNRSIAKFDEMQAKKLGKNLADLPTVRKTGAAQETSKMGPSKPKIRKNRCQTADAALLEMLNKRNMEGGLRSFDRGDMNYSIIRNNHYIPVLSVQTAAMKLEHEMPTKKEQSVVKCAETATTETKIKRKKTCKQQKAKIKVKMSFNEKNKKNKRIEKCKTKKGKRIGGSEKTTPAKSRTRVFKKKQQTKVKEIPQVNTIVNSDDITHWYCQEIHEEVQKTVSIKHQEQKVTSEFETPLTPSVKVKRKNKNITEAVEHSLKEEQKTDAAEEKKTQTRRITPVKIGEVDTSTTGNLMEEGTKKRKINTTFKDERPGKVQKTNVEFGISSQSPLPHIEGMLKLFEKKTSATHVYTDCNLGSIKTTSFQRKLSDLAETNAVDASNDNTVNQINLDSKDVSLLGTLEKVILDNMTEYLGDKSLHSFGSEDKTRGIKTSHDEPQNGNEYVDNLDFSNMLEKNLNTSTPIKSLKENNEVDVPEVSANHQEKQIDSGSTLVAINDCKSYLVTPIKRDRRRRVRVVQLIQKT